MKRSASPCWASRSASRKSAVACSTPSGPSCMATSPASTATCVRSELDSAAERGKRALVGGGSLGDVARPGQHPSQGQQRERVVERARIPRLAFPQGSERLGLPTERGEGPPLEHARGPLAGQSLVGLPGRIERRGCHRRRAGQLGRSAREQVAVALQLGRLGALPYVRPTAPVVGALGGSAAPGPRRPRGDQLRELRELHEPHDKGCDDQHLLARA